MIYGRLTPAEVAERGDNPFIEANGRVYRITETHKTMVGVTNYQAEECDPREYERWTAERAAQELADSLAKVAEEKDEPDDDGAAGVREPRRPQPDQPPTAAKAEHAYDPETGWYGGLPVPTPSIPARKAPTLDERMWARNNGWKGQGPIPKAVRKAYRERDSEPAQTE